MRVSILKENYLFAILSIALLTCMLFLMDCQSLNCSPVLNKVLIDEYFTFKDDTACLAINEHPTWNASHGLLGLLQCNVPAVLKGDILLALNQLARIPEISLGFLQALEGIVEINPQTGNLYMLLIIYLALCPRDLDIYKPSPNEPINQTNS